jgi:hypothetical protein
MKNMLPLPEVIALNDRMYNKNIAEDGFSRLEKSSIEVENFFNQINEVKRQAKISLFLKNKKNKLVYEKLSDFKLTFKPFEFNKGRSIAVIPSGTIINNAWTSVERWFELPSGIVKLEESDFEASGGKIFMIKSDLNTKIRGKEAVSIVLKNNNASLEVVSWVENNMSYTLTFQPTVSDMILPSTINVAKNNIPVKNIAHTLTQELK